MPEITEDQLTEWRFGTARPMTNEQIKELRTLLADPPPPAITWVKALEIALRDALDALEAEQAKHDRLLGGFGDLQELLNALAVEQAKVTRLREALDTIICNHLDNQRPNLLIAARVLKETE